MRVGFLSAVGLVALLLGWASLRTLSGAAPFHGGRENNSEPLSVKLPTELHWVRTLLCRDEARP